MHIIQRTLVTGLLLVAAFAGLAAYAQPAHAGNAPEFTLTDIDGGTTYSLSDFRGKWVLIDFWASW